MVELIIFTSCPIRIYGEKQLPLTDIDSLVPVLRLTQAEADWQNYIQEGHESYVEQV